MPSLMSDEAPPPLDVAGIARRQFATARKGLDTNEVRRYLEELSRQVAELQRREAEQRARADEAEVRVAAAEHLDEHRLVELLGSETARVLESAREAATDIRTKAEESAARLISEANQEANRVRAEAEATVAARRLEMLADIEGVQREAATELERRRAEGDELAAEMRRDAEREAEALRAEAQEEGRQLVDEAIVVRERMLRDLARRRRAARQQVERLNAARERLLAAHEVVRRTVDEATTELTVALPEARLAAEAAMRRVEGEPEPTVEELDEMVAMARIAGLVDVSKPSTADERDESGERAPDVETPTVAVSGDEADDEVEPDDEAVEVVVEITEVAEVVEIDLVDEAPEPDADEAAEVVDDEVGFAEDDADVVDLDDDDIELDELDDELVTVDELADAPAGSSVDRLFARLRAQTGDAPDAHDDELVVVNGVELEVDPLDVDQDAYGAAAIYQREQTVAVLEEDAEPEPEDDADVDPDAIHHVDQAPEAGRLLERRDKILASVESDVARRLKMVLADEQNEVLDALRRGKAPEGIDDLLPAHGPHTQRYTEAAREDLAMVAELGAEAVGGEPDGTGEALAAELAQTVVEPLRERVVRCIDDADGELSEVTQRLRSLYREWKSQRIGDAVRHFTAAAYAHGAYAAVPNGSELCWLVDRSGASCPDADDNALAGAVRKGEPFPTGDHCPPAHQGCRCLVVPYARLNEPHAHK
jgi:cell division septum initiation protein DivIVA